MANTLTFANQTLTDADIFGGISFLHDLNTGDEFSIGNTAAASVKFVTNTQLPLYSKDATNGTFTWTQDSTPRGRFYITEVTKERGMYTVTAYDAMLLLEKSISALSLSFPLTVSAAASAIATYIGCTVSGTLVNGALSVTALDVDMTCRQLLHYVAEASGCSVKIDGSDHLCLMYYASSGITVTASQYKTLEVADYTCAKIDNVTIYNSEGEIQATAGSGYNALYIGSNPFLDSATATEATNILNKVKDFQYAPFRCEMFEENGLEVGKTTTFGSITTLVMHIESSEEGAFASAVGNDTRADYNKDILTVVNETAAIAVNAQTISGQVAGILSDMQTAATAAGTTLNGIYADAESAHSTLAGMQTAAIAAGTTLNGIYADAVNAQAAATNASEYAARALGNLSTVQSVAETLTWITAHGTMTLTSDVALDPTHVYFVQNDSTGEYTVGAHKYDVVTEPDVADIGTYYELTIDESLNNYVGTHLALDGEGLWLLPAASGVDRVLIATGNGTTYTTAGTYIIDSTGGISASFRGDGATINGPNNTLIAHLGYGTTSTSGSDQPAPYYTLGQRKTAATAYSPTSTYELGDLCVYGNTIYVCTTAITTPEAFNNAHWALPTGAYSTVMGVDNIAARKASHAEGTRTTAIAHNSHAEGEETKALAMSAHAEGLGTIASGTHSHAEGYTAEASGFASHAEGNSARSIGYHSHAEGEATTANGRNSHAQNHGTIAGSDNQTALGKYNVLDANDTYAVIIGNGASGARNNALAVTWDGDVLIDLPDYQTTGTTDKAIYDAVVALGWDSDVLVN